MMNKNLLNQRSDGETTEVQNFYKDANILITGGSGFLGHLLIQKLISDCPGVNKIYLLMRSKKGKPAEKRLEEMFEDPVFEKMKLKRPEYKKMVKILHGNLEQPNLGLQEQDQNLLSNEINVIFHVGATVRFDEKIKIACNINLKATQDLIKIAKTMTNLKVFVHCSTAYSQCPHKVIEERFYHMPQPPSRLIQITNVLDDDELEILTPKLILNWPNTYSYTKGLTETIIKEEGHDLPITIVRPSMVTTTVDDPVEGWINNFYGPAGVSLGVALGVLRVMLIKKEKIGDLIPGDYVANTMICAAHHVGTTYGKHNNNNSPDNIKLSDNDVPIFNCVSGPENPITWDDFRHYGYNITQWGPKEAIWYYVLFFVRSRLATDILQFLLHTIPAYLIDFVLTLRGKKRRMIKLATKINYFTRLISYFTTKEWDFKNDNTQALWNNLSSEDKTIFRFSIKNLDWEKYFAEKYGKGVYLYICKNKLSKLEKARSRYKKLQYLHYAVVYGFYSICVTIFLYFVLKMF